MVTYKVFRAIHALFLAAVVLAVEIDSLTDAQDAELTTITTTVQFTIFEVQDSASPTSISITLESAAVLQQSYTSIPALSITAVGCEMTLPGLVMHTCAVMPTTSSQPKNLATMTQLASIDSVVTQTIISMLVAGPETKTVTQVLTPDAGSSSLATGFCFWDEQQILMPCTDMVAATAKPSTSAAFRARINPLQRLIGYIKVFSNRISATSHGRANPDKQADSSILWDDAYV